MMMMMIAMAVCYRRHFAIRPNKCTVWRQHKRNSMENMCTEKKPTRVINMQNFVHNFPSKVLQCPQPIWVLFYSIYVSYCVYLDVLSGIHLFSIAQCLFNFYNLRLWWDKECNAWGHNATWLDLFLELNHRLEKRTSACFLKNLIEYNSPQKHLCPSKTQSNEWILFWLFWGLLWIRAMNLSQISQRSVNNSASQ